MPFCEDCLKGVTHEGTPTGKMETIGGVECYVATPEGDYPKDKVLLYLSDIYGLPLVNSKLLVDDFARNGFKTIFPDYLNGDPIPQNAFEIGMTVPDIIKWQETGHTSAVTRPILDNVMTALKDTGVTAFGATGYCFGGRYVFDLAFDNVLQVGVIAHPSDLHVPEDMEKYVSASRVPLLLNSCTFDFMLPEEVLPEVDRIFATFTTTPDAEPGSGYKREHFEGCTHGFAVRGDMSDPKIKAGKEGAFKATVEWLWKHL